MQVREKLFFVSGGVLTALLCVKGQRHSGASSGKPLRTEYDRQSLRLHTSLHLHLNLAIPINDDALCDSLILHPVLAGSAVEAAPARNQPLGNCG
ncbi:hypothetical protein HNR05_000047 [Leifsonia psychrotolerans]|uniref:Uncharacterized protein n=1 Tax=Glaciibacter psychrotolerans TaxID=670054 RepID=A0A7Z0EB75_9MICO|nr:hypothetical protein [Leifsonia psychrotolerans]